MQAATLRSTVQRSLPLFGRSAAGAPSASSCFVLPSPQQQQRRGMATEKQIKMQIDATKNIKKITSSMKMVSAAKLKGDENRLALAKPFAAWSGPLVSEPKEFDDDTSFEDLPQKTLIIPFTSDRGLCGGINSFITRSVRRTVSSIVEQGKECDVCIIGDKGRSQLRRIISDQIKLTTTEVALPGTFNLASALTAEIMAATKDSEYEGIMFIYNSYVNAAVYKQMYKILTPFSDEGEEGEPLPLHEFDGDKAEVMEDMYEYLVASNIFYCFMDAAAAEQSSRMTAMENASKNANEMIDSLTLQYNRARQARITTELIEIISGASALDD